MKLVLSPILHLWYCRNEFSVVVSLGLGREKVRFWRRVGSLVPKYWLMPLVPCQSNHSFMLQNVVFRLQVMIH